MKKSIWQFVNLPLGGSRTLQQRQVCPVSKAHYQKSKASGGPKEGMWMSLYKGHTLVIKTYFIRPVLSMFFSNTIDYLLHAE